MTAFGLFAQFGQGVPARGSFLLQIDTPIEVERFDPPKPLYCRHLSSKNVVFPLLFAHF